MNESADAALAQVLHSGYIGQGRKVDAFEEVLARKMDRQPITVNSGTSALVMALRLAGVDYGDEVISTPMTCSATNIAIKQLGAHPRWADIDPRTGLIDPASVKRLLKARRPRWARHKAIMAVDWGGQPADYDELMVHGIPVISDAAHSFGSLYKGRKTGSVADYTCFSFQAIKHLTTGDGGALVPPLEQMKRAKDMRWFGLDREQKTDFRGEQDIVEWGYKFHMNDIAATIGLANFDIVDEVLMAHRSNAKLLDSLLDKRFVRTAPEYDHQGSWWIYTILLPSQAVRDAFKAHMDASGVQVSQVHWRNDTQTVFKDVAVKDELPGVDEFSSRMICLPVHSRAPAKEVAEAANKFFDS